MQEREPHQTAIEAPHVLEEHEMPNPEIGDYRKTGEKGEKPGPVFQEALEQSASVEIRRRFGQDQIHGEEGKRDRVYAVSQEDEAVEPWVLLGLGRSGQAGAAIFGYGSLPEALALVPHNFHRNYLFTLDPGDIEKA